jgi:hypothetical protein
VLKILWKGVSVLLKALLWLLLLPFKLLGRIFRRRK